MKKLIISSALTLFCGIISAQPTDKKISKITFHMVDGEYEDAAYKADKLTSDSEYRKNAWVYFYLSQAYYEIAKIPELQEDFPKAMKDALKAAYKLYKYKDKPEENLEVYNEAKEYLSVLKDSVITISEIYYDNENYRKAAYYLDKINKFDPDDHAVDLMKGIYQIKSRNIGEGVKSIMRAMEKIDENYVPDEVSAQTLVDALEEYALIVKSGEYDQYFEVYKFKPTESDISNALAMRDDFKKYIVGKEKSKEERKQESETIYKTFKSSDLEDDNESDDE